MRRVTEQVTRTFEATANRPNMGTESGIIEEVDCTNFMCHGHLTIPLGPLINFITGNNGSGKSAVLTALTICLGGKATATNRAQNLKSLIKEGTEHARVLVRIKNQGPLAYKPMLYGTSITVERHFSRSGTSGFKLRDQAGKLVSTKKSELEDILDAFSMQIDNPMNVLTQDMARQFLNSSTPKDKYSFFLKGTQLENLSRDYQQIESSLELMNSRAEVKKADLDILRKKMEELHKKVTKADNSAKMRAAETKVGNEALWAHVEEAEAELVKMDTGLARVARIISNNNRKVEAASEAYENSNKALEVAQEKVRTRTEGMEPAKQEVDLLRETWDKLKAKVFALLADERTMSADFKAKTNAVQKCKDDIEQVRERQAAADDGRYAEKVRQLDEAKTVAERAKAALEAHGTEAPSIKEQYITARDKLLLATREVEKARKDEREIRDKIQKLRSGQRNWTDSYRAPANLQNLLRAIGTERFHESPVGPLGRYVTLIKPEWGYILDKQFGVSLNAFVVTSRADQVKLNELMKRCRWEAPIYIGNSNPLNTTPQEPDSELLTWMRALRIENHLVRNQFIINQSIEQVVLIDNRQEGVRLMQARPIARNVKLCFTFADGDKRRGRVLQNTNSGGFNDSPIKEFSGNLRMQADKENQIIAEQAQLEGVQQELKVLERAERDMQELLERCKTTGKEHQKQQRELVVAKQKADGAVERLEWELSDAIPDAATIEVLEESLTSAEQELKRVVDVLEDLVVAKDVADRNSKAGKKNLEEAQAMLSNLDSELAEARSAVRTLQHQREDDLKKKNAAITEVAAAEANQNDWELQREVVQQKVDNQTTAAMNLCPVRVPVPPGKTAEWLQNHLKRITATREQAEKEQGGSRQELLAAARKAMDAHETASNEFQDIESLKMVSYLAVSLQTHH